MNIYPLDIQLIMIPLVLLFNFESIASFASRTISKICLPSRNGMLISRNYFPTETELVSELFKIQINYKAGDYN